MANTDVWQDLAKTPIPPRFFPCRRCGKKADKGFLTDVAKVSYVGRPIYDVEFLCTGQGKDLGCAAGQTPLMSAMNIPLRFEVTAVLGPSHVRVVRRSREEASRMAAGVY